MSTRSYRDSNAAQKVWDAVINEEAALARQEEWNKEEIADLDARGVPVHAAGLTQGEVDEMDEEASRQTAFYRLAREQREKNMEKMKQNQRDREAILEAVSQPGAYPDAQKSKDITQHHRMKCLEFLNKTREDASAAEIDSYPSLPYAAIQVPNNLLPSTELTQEYILWALGPGIEKKDSYTAHEIFECLVQARQLIDFKDSQIGSIMDSRAAHQQDVHKSLSNIDLSSGKIGQMVDRIDNTTQRIDAAVYQLATSVEGMGITGEAPKRRRSSLQDLGTPPLRRSTAGSTPSSATSAPAGFGTLSTHQTGSTSTPQLLQPTASSAPSSATSAPTGFGTFPSHQSAATSNPQLPQPTASSTPSFTTSAPTGFGAPSPPSRQSGAATSTGSPTTPNLPGNSGLQLAQSAPDLRTVDSVAARFFVNRDGVEQNISTLPAAVLDPLMAQLSAMFCKISPKRYREAMEGKPNKTGCTMQKSKGMGSADESDTACGECRAVKRFCAKKFRGGTTVLIVPLPEDMRGDATMDDHAYWVES